MEKTNSKKRPLRALQIIGDSKFGGGTIVVCNMMKMLQAHGVEVEVLATDPETIEFFHKNDFKVWQFKSIQRAINPIIDMLSVVRLTRELHGRYDIIHTNTTKGGVTGRIAAWFARTPVILHTVHGFAFHEFSSKLTTTVIGSIERILSMMCDRIIFVNNHDRIKSVDMGILPNHKAVTVFNGISEERLVAGLSSDRDKLLNELNLNKDVFLSVFVGRLAKQKGLRYLLEAIKIVHSRLPQCNIHQIIVGDGELKQNCHQWVEEFGITDRVHFLGFQPEAVRWTGGGDLFILSSLWEGHSITLLEAMGCGKAIVATDIKGNRESIQNEHDGLLVSAGNAESLAEGIIRVISNAEFANSLGKNARNSFEKSFTTEKMLENAWVVYEDVLNEKGLLPI